ncbi:Fe-S oxidoreductase [Halogeometricum borinquense DSM 11551]|uniref:Fe-S oxidoreductase n=1 Tax=Halogeometricum borinquense (strain ATCC 700274 / DSM 11551 / JCM 10706 / KCTC 4070 / PR3) TaxID=469382 RepID=E4NRG0_HALBP|nr:YkgJ family cysteine cluster protein [Halogeometricum borinquense]ADQ68001.1 predicted Fe-S oxidoreductase [Halogeometricum borinquense DSM 11551]ELY24078.1 Fe-S oxidoreductase [Halogeometricum borinquense DSM 11551]
MSHAGPTLEDELERARDLSVAELADAIESIGFECTRCGACCKGHGPADDREPHTATVFPDEVRAVQDATETESYDWRDVARPMPYGLTEGDDGPEGETFEWALQTDACGDCVFYEESEGADGTTGACSIHSDRPLICETYPFSVALGGTSQPMGEAVDSVALGDQQDPDETDDEAMTVRAHECEGLGRDISREDAEELAAALKERAVRELEEAIGVRDEYEPVQTESGEVVVHDSEGAKNPDGTPIEE